MSNKKINSQIKKYKQLVENIEEEVKRTLLLLQPIDVYYSIGDTNIDDVEITLCPDDDYVRITCQENYIIKYTSINFSLLYLSEEELIKKAIQLKERYDKIEPLDFYTKKERNLIQKKLNEDYLLSVELERDVISMALHDTNFIINNYELFLKQVKKTLKIMSKIDVKYNIYFETFYINIENDNITILNSQSLYNGVISFPKHWLLLDKKQLIIECEKMEKLETKQTEHKKRPIEIQIMIDRYLELINSNLHRTEEGISLRSNLISLIGIDSIEFCRFDALIYTIEL